MTIQDAQGKITELQTAITGLIDSMKAAFTALEAKGATQGDTQPLIDQLAPLIQVVVDAKSQADAIVNPVA